MLWVFNIHPQLDLMISHVRYMVLHYVYIYKLRYFIHFYTYLTTSSKPEQLRQRSDGGRKSCFVRLLDWVRVSISYCVNNLINEMKRFPTLITTIPNILNIS